MRPLLFVLVAAVTLAACGDEGRDGFGPSPGLVTRTEVFTGTTRALANGTCTGDTHTFEAGPGSVSVTLFQTTPSEPLLAEICEPGAQKPIGCAVPRTRINVGQTLTGNRSASAEQILTFLPLTCGGSGAFTPTTVEYTSTVVHQRP